MKRIFTLMVVLLATTWSLALAQPSAPQNGTCRLLSPDMETWQECYARVTRNLVKDEVPDSAMRQYRRQTYDLLLTCIGEDVGKGAAFGNFVGKGWAVLQSEETHQISGYYTWRETDRLFLHMVDSADLCVFFYIGHPDVTVLLKRTDNDVPVPNLARFDTTQAITYGATRLKGKNPEEVRTGWQQLKMRKLTELLNSQAADSVLRDWQLRFDLTPTVADPLGWHQDAILPLESSLFKNLGGIELCTVMVGKWRLLRFPGSQLVHFVYDYQAKLAAK